MTSSPIYYGAGYLSQAAWWRVGFCGHRFLVRVAWARLVEGVGVVEIAVSVLRPEKVQPGKRTRPSVFVFWGCRFTQSPRISAERALSWVSLGNS